MGKLAKKKQELLEVSNECINCNASLDLDQRFCSNCGGKRMFNRITWRNFFEDFIDRFLNIENAFLKTFLGLFKHPEDVIGGYMSGMRKKYLPAFSYFAIAITVAGFSAFIMKNWFIDDIAAATQGGLFGDMPQAEFQEEFTKDWLNFATDYQSVFYFLSIPILALISRLVFWNYKKYNLVEHFVIYLYSYSHITMIITGLGLLTMWNQDIYQVFSFFNFPIMIFYVGYVLKRLYSLDAGGIILKTGLFAIVMGFVFAISSLTFGLYLIKSSMDKAPSEDDNPFVKLMKQSFEKGKQIGKERAIKERKEDSLEQLKKAKIDTTFIQGN